VTVLLFIVAGLVVLMALAFALAPLWALFTSLGLLLGVDGLKRVGC